MSILNPAFGYHKAYRIVLYHCLQTNVTSQMRPKGG